MSDPDDFDEALRDLHRFSEKKKEAPSKIEAAHFGDLSQLEDDYQFSPDEELILGDDYVTYLLFADGKEIADFDVHTEESGLEVKTEDFVVRKNLGMRIDPDDSTTTYANGVLSIRVRLIASRDAVA